MEINIETLKDYRNFHSHEYDKEIQELKRIIKETPSIYISDAYLKDATSYQDAIQKMTIDLIERRLLDPRDLTERPERFLALLKVIMCFDVSLCAKLSIHYQLFCNSVLLLSTARHAAVISGGFSKPCRVIGGFAMTEMGHGSNVRALETLAVFD